MILHSDFRDYYDNAIGYGVDQKVHYNRYVKKASIDVKSNLDRPFHRESGLLGFCGKLYPFIEVTRYGHDLDVQGRLKIEETRFAFDAKEYIEIKKEWGLSGNNLFWHAFTKDPKVEQFFRDWSRDSDEQFLEHKVPIWVARFYSGEPNGILNPRLTDYGFERKLDAIAAFQEISMYLANILVEQKEVAIIEDKFRIEQHGFDLKESFRNQKNRR